jgi:hypothetical protein
MGGSRRKFQRQPPMSMAAATTVQAILSEMLAQYVSYNEGDDSTHDGRPYVTPNSFDIPRSEVKSQSEPKSY